MPATPGAGEGYAYLEAVYRDAERRLEAIVRAAALNERNWTEHRAKLQLLQVQQLVARLHAQAAALADDSIHTAYSAAVRAVNFHTAGLTSAGAGTAATALSTGINQQAIATLVASLTSHLEAATRTVGRQAHDAFQRVGVHHSAVGLATGETRRAISGHMVNDLVTQGVSGFVDKGGRRWSLSAYTNMAARTTTREAMSLGTRERMEGIGMDLVTISDHGDTDELCDEFAGNTYSLTGSTPGYEVLSDDPPFHPNCIHVMTPAEVDMESFLSSLTEGVEEGAVADAGAGEAASALETPADIYASGLSAAEQRQRLRQLGSQ